MKEHVGEGNGVKFEAGLRIKAAGGTVSSVGPAADASGTSPGTCAGETGMPVTAARWGD